MICVLAVAVLAAALSITPTYAQSNRAKWYVDKQNLGAIGERINSKTITIVTGNRDATLLTIGYDLSAVLDEDDEFRVLPMMGKGGGQTLRDVRFLKGVDLGIVHSNLLNAFRESGEIGTPDGKIVYITKLFNEEMHLLVRADSGIATIEQLAGKTVNFGDAGSGTQFAARDIFSRLGIKVAEVNVGQVDALARLKSGALDATVLIAGKPADVIATLSAQDGLRLLPVPFAKKLQDDYLPATLSEDDYPAMIAAGDGVQTVAVGAVLIAYNWPRGSEPYRRVETFVGRFFSKLNEFRRPPRHPKWRETNVAATLPGWARFPAAEEWLERNRQVAASRSQFDAFLQSRADATGPIDTPQERARLFSDFIKWRERR